MMSPVDWGHFPPQNDSDRIAEAEAERCETCGKVLTDEDGLMNPDLSASICDGCEHDDGLSLTRERKD